MSLRWRTALLVFALTALATAGAFAAVSYAFVDLQRRQLDQAILAIAEWEARSAARGSLAFTDAPGPSPEDVGSLPKYGAIYDGEGGVVATTDAWAGRAPSFARLPRELGRAFDLVGSPTLRAVLVQVPGRPHRVLLATTRHDLDNDKAYLARAMIVAFVVSAVGAFTAASRLASRLARGHDAIAAVARRVAKGDLTARVGALAIGRDTITFGRDVDAMIDQLCALLAAQKRFLANAAHELRTPLATLHLELQHAQRSASGEEAYAAAVVEALAGTQRLRALADDLLALARADEKGAEAEPVWIREIVRDAVEEAEPFAQRTGVILATSSVEGCSLGRRRDLTRMLRNLLENAIRYSPPGRTVTVTTAASERAVTISVVDEGLGIPEVERARVFEPFFRGAHARASVPDGSGLGLSIAREIARAHGGDVSLAPPRDRGTTFLVTLPAPQER